jgi:hypothetical protein
MSFSCSLNRDGDAREIAIIKYAEYAELDIAAVRQLYPRRDVHHFTPENKRIVRDQISLCSHHHLCFCSRNRSITTMNPTWMESSWIV